MPVIPLMADECPPGSDLFPPLCVQRTGEEGRSGALADTPPVWGFPSKEHDLRLCAEARNRAGICRVLLARQTQCLVIAGLGELNAQLPAIP